METIAQCAMAAVGAGLILILVLVAFVCGMFFGVYKSEEELDNMSVVEFMKRKAKKLIE